MLIDLHTHTYPRSYDALQTPEELVLEARGLGLDGICLTEHDEFWDPSELQGLARQHNLLILPGCEVNTDDGHFLAFALREYVFGIHRLPFLWREVERAGGALVAAHPYRRRRIGTEGGCDLTGKVDLASREDAFQMCHAVEGLNGRGSRTENSFSMELARRLGMGATGGSDSHAPGGVGACATEFDARISCLDDLIRELKGGRFRPVSLKQRKH